jgi:hypothetical protein
MVGKSFGSLAGRVVEQHAFEQHVDGVPIRKVIKHFASLLILAIGVRFRNHVEDGIWHNSLPPVHWMSL